MTTKENITIDEIVSDLKNPEQEKTVRLMENACVSAGAGSGKTRVLATRYVYLVAKYGYSPSEILTLTFTNKAANEMYTRIYKSLVEYSERITEPTEKANLLAAINRFQESKILTLDSYCKKLISSNIHKFGITPDFSLDKKDLEDVINFKAIEFLLKNRKNPYLQFFLGTDNPEIFAKDFFSKIILENSTICNPIDFMDNYKMQIEYSKKKWTDFANEVNLLVTDTEKTLNEFGNTGTPSVKEKIQNLWNKIPSVQCNPDTEDFSKNQHLSDWYPWISDLASINKSYCKELQPHIETAKDLLKKMLPYFNFLYYSEELKGICQLLEIFQEEVQNTKRSMGLLTFADVAALAIESLLKYPELRLIEKKSYKAIMIDEFQDDNILQKELLFLLAEKEDLCSSRIPLASELNPEKLFFVGDEKQSIYKFRGADVEVFRKLSDELSGKATLSTNYRSEPALVAAFNTIFGGVKYPLAKQEEIEAYFAESSNCDVASVFKKNDSNLEDYEATYNLTKAAPHKLKNPDYSPRMHIVLVDENKTEISSEINENAEYFSKKESEAIYVVEKIKDLLALEENKKPVYQPKDIAILFKSTTNQHVFERFLKIQGIPYSCGKQKGFFYDAPINDILSILKVALFPKDLLSFSIFLNSPFVRLSEKSTNLIISILSNEKQTKGYFKNPLKDEQFENLKNQLPEEEQEKYQFGKNIILELQEFIKNHTIAQTITKIFYDFGYYFETIWNNNVSIYSELYDLLFSLATKSDSRNENLSDFLLNLQNMENNPSEMEDISVPLERGNAVQLMTIHGSKGLEFPVVFIVGINDRPKFIRDDKNACFHKDFGLAVKLPLHPDLDKDTKRSWVFELTREEEQKKENAEARRVLYVAITRAEKELYLTGHKSTSEEKGEKTTCNFYDLLKSNIEKYVDFETVTEKKDSPFTYEEIPLMEKDDFAIQEENKNTAKNRVLFIEKNKEIYEKADIIETPIIDLNIIKPSKVKNENEELAKAIFPKINNLTFEDYTTFKPIWKNLETEKLFDNKKLGFTAQNFGTLIHLYIEHFFKNKNFDLIVPANLQANLSSKMLETVKKEAQNLAQGFLNSDLGQKALKSSWCKSEYDFKMSVNINNQIYIIDGQIDLIFKDEETGKIIVLDFKSDKRIIPEEHISQLQLYKNTAAELASVDKSMVETYIFYLRFEKALFFAL